MMISTNTGAAILSQRLVCSSTLAVPHCGTSTFSSTIGETLLGGQALITSGQSKTGPRPCAIVLTPIALPCY